MKYLKTDVTFEIGNETFTCTGKQIVEPGFSSVMHWRSQQDENLPMIDKGASYPVVDINSKESETTPPEYLSEADLLGLMEKYGIGTDASMAVHIASICSRNYVNVKNLFFFLKKKKKKKKKKIIKIYIYKYVYKLTQLLYFIYLFYLFIIF